MRILVTGGAGFIGSHTALTLANSNHEVLVVDNLDPYYQISLKEYNLQILKAKGIQFKKIDIRYVDSLKRVFKNFKPEIVIHLAAKAGVRNSIQYPEEYFQTNVDGTLNILQASKEYGISKIMIASSSSVYGTNEKVPFVEDDPVENQISPYASSKRAVEIMSKMYYKVYGLKIQLFRFFTVYGPSGRPDMAPIIFTKSLNEGKPIKIFGSLETERDYTFIEDITSGLAKALKQDDNFEIYNLGNNNPIKLREFVSIIEKELGKKAKLVFLPFQTGDVKKTWADIGKSSTAFGFSPKTSPTIGMKKMISWYLDHQDLYP